MNAAREKVRVAHALKQLPLISASFATGELSFSKVRAVTRIAEPENEKELLELARYATAAQVEKLMRARLPAEEGAVVLQALNAAMDARDAEQNEAEPEDVTAVTSAMENRFAHRGADALTTMAIITALRL